MKVRLAGALGFIMALVAACPLAAQTPALSNVEAPYPALQSSVHIAGATYGPGAVSYGPVGTPLTLSGSNFGSGGAGSTILFPGAQKGTTIAATATSWSGSIVLVTVPSGATSGLVQVSVGGQISNGLPLIVTRGSYSGSCPTSPPGTEVTVITSSLPNGSVGTAYSATLSAEGGTPPYTWSMTGGPTWLTLVPSTGALTGTPTTAGGPYNLVVHVTDSHSQAAQAMLSLSLDSQTLVAGKVYSYTALYDPAGNVSGYSDYLNAQTNYVMGMWAFSYDTLNRLMSATPGTGAPGNYTNLNLCMNYDSFGNRKQSDFQAASCNPTSDPVTAKYSSTNQVTWTTVNSATSGFVYDAAGNVIFDGANYYAYDGEGRLCAVQSNPVSGGPTAYEYIYDAEGRRVAKGTITASLNPLSQPLSCNPASNGFTLTESYVVGQGGEQLTTLNGSQNWVRTNVYGGAQLLATYDVQGLHFHLADPLGTRRVQTSVAGVAEEDCQGLPFGDGLNCFTVPNAPASADESTPLHFTGQQRDTESGLDNFGARYYGSSMGRFLSSDPSGLVYADPKNPQSLNLYAYVLNNPLIHIDPRGLDCVYFSDAGDKVESVDHDSDSGECGSNGGDWVNGTTYSNLASYNSKSDTWNIGSYGNEGGTPTVYFTQAYAPGPGGGGTDQSGNSISCSGNCDTANGYSYTGYAFFGDQIANLNTYDALHWAVGQTDQVSKFQKWIVNDPDGRNWCGTGGAGVPSGGDDWSCMAHDYNYTSTGNIYRNNLVPFSGNKQLQQINQTLCDNVSSSDIKDFFTYTSFAGCH